MQENTTESEKMNLTEAAPPATKEEEPKKAKRPYAWTPKRKEAFDKMRKGLEEKISLTKQLKDEKRKAEKEAIKAQVRKIMNRKSKSKDEDSASDTGDLSSNESSSSEEEIVVKKKKHSSKKESSGKREEKSKKKSSKNKRVVDETTQEEFSSSESEPELKAVPSHSNVYTQKQHKEYQQSKVERGKAVRRAQFVHPLDQFILL